MPAFIFPNSEGTSTRTLERWSHAARLAAAAGRKKAGKGLGARQKAVRSTFVAKVGQHHKGVPYMQRLITGFSKSAANAKTKRRQNTKNSMVNKIATKNYNAQKKQNPENYYLFSYS